MAICSKYTLVHVSVRALFVWNYQRQSLNRGDEVLQLPLCCLQPYKIFIPDPFGSGEAAGKEVEGIMTIHWRTKTSQLGVSVLRLHYHLRY